jgi:hypothetical protein
MLTHFRNYPIDISIFNVVITNAMDVVKECDIINDIFEEHYVNRSIIVCNDAAKLFAMTTTLTTQCFPLQVVSKNDYMKAFKRLQDGNVRMLIMNEVMFYIITRNYAHVLNDVNFIFVSKGSKLVGRVDVSNKNIISLT